MTPYFSFRRILLLSLVSRTASFQVLDVGAPRTGTQSLHVALEILGLKALHTGVNTSTRIPWCVWMLSGKRLPPPTAMLKDYDAAMDEPMQLIYPEVLKAFPDAKFIYTLRDPEEWFASYDSIMHDIYAKGKLDKNLKKSLRKPGQKKEPLASLADNIGDAVVSVYVSCLGCA